MDKKFFIELTNDLYRLTILFPKEEPIRIKLRSLADDALADLVTILEGDSEEKVEAAKNVEKTLGILDSMLQIAREQKWTEEDDFDEVIDSYQSIKEEIEEFNELQSKKKKKEEKPLKKERKPQSGKGVISLNNRQKRILEILEKRGKMQVGDIMDALDLSVTKRTIRRDFQKLMDMHFVEREGVANMTRYKIKQ